MPDNEKIESTTEEPEVVGHVSSDEDDELAYDADSAGWCITN